MDHLVVLTASPLNGLTDLRIAEVHDLLDGAGEPRRLSADAAEIPVGRPQRPDLAGLDVNCIAAAGRRKRLLISDMDSTVITVECIDELAEAAGVRDRVQPVTERAMRGEIGFEDALRERVALMAGLDEGQLQHVHDSRIALTPGARTLVATMRANGAHTALVSGGFTFFTERVAAAAGFDEHRANMLEIADGCLTGRVVEPVLGRLAKLEALTALAVRYGLTPRDVLAAGDGANDLAMIEAAGLGVAFRAKPLVADRAGASIRHGDLTALLYLQGYSADEFVTA